MRVVDEFELEGGVALENFIELCKNVDEGTVLVGEPCKLGMSFSLNGSVLGFLLGDDSVFARYAYNNGFSVYARVTSVRRTEKVPVIFASLHFADNIATMGELKDNLKKEKIFL